MSSKITPSQRMHSYVNPLPIAEGYGETENAAIYWLKVIFGTPISFFMILYAIALLTSMSGMEFAGWSTAALTLIYITLDFGSKHREFRPFLIGTDFSLLGFIIVVFVGLKFNAPNADIVTEMGHIRWIPLLYLLAYSFSLFPGLNRLFYVIFGLSFVISIYAIFQHFTGVDLRFEWGLREQSAVTPAPVSHSDSYQSVGLMSHHLTYGYLFAMIFCFSFAALTLSRGRSVVLRMFFLVNTLTIGASLVWTYGRGVWIATLAAVLFMGAYLSRKALFLVLIVLSIVGATLYSTNTSFRDRTDQIFQTDNTSNNDRKDLWRANVAMLAEYPWFGVGWGQNEVRVFEFYEKIGIQNKFGGHAHNSYLQILATTGILGSITFSLFIIGFLLMTHRLWTDIPKSHFWHRVIALGALGSQIAMHTGGMTQWNFGDAEVNHFFIFVLAVVAYMSERYSVGVVPDDHTL